jgi:SWI/SNF-related matrix-associated actin-dependent regulator of chromatin subfamily A-like protein 1
MNTEMLADIDPALEAIFERYGAVAQGILESLPWIEAVSADQPAVRRVFVAKAYSAHAFWSVLWRPNKVYWQRLGFSVTKPAEDWLVTFKFNDPARQAEALAASHAVLASGGEMPVPPGLRYFEYQKAGVQFLVRTPSALLADEPGVGKTIQVCGLLNAEATIRSILIICPASVKFVWARELKKWLVSPRSVSAAGKDLDTSADIVIVNYDLLRKFRALLRERPFDLVVLDEAHYIKTPSAQRTKAAKAIAAPAKRKVLLTGTPIMSRPSELWALLNLLDAKSWGAFFPFAKRYCAAEKTAFGWDFSGASNLEELSTRLRSSGAFLRRTKAEVLPQLPKVIRQVVPLDVDMSPLLEELTEALAEKMGFNPDNPPFEIDPTTIPFDMVSAIRHETGLLKTEAAINFVLESATDSEKIIIFAHHKDVLTALAAALPGAVKVTGESSAKNRQLAVDDFQNDASVKYFIASTTAMGVGITLTAASRVIFVESDWTPAAMEQAEARAHRIGQNTSVLVQYLTVRDTIDERIMNTLVAKMEVIGAVLEGK